MNVTNEFIINHLINFFSISGNQGSERRNDERDRSKIKQLEDRSIQLGTFLFQTFYFVFIYLSKKLVSKFVLPL